MLHLSRQQKAVVFGSWLGWSLDGYDLVLMLLVMPSVSQLFFPNQDPTLSLLATFATYVITLIMRPVGGAFFGSFGDRHGRKKAMIITIMGFSIATFATGLLPTYAMVGLLAPALLILVRFAQGIFAGGEWASGAVITMETAPRQHRGLLSGFVQSGFTLGFLIASITFQYASVAYAGDAFLETGWRVMFYTGIIPGLVALFVRFKMNESEVWLETARKKRVERAPLRRVMFSREERKRFFLSLILMTGLMYAWYTSMGFMPTYLHQYVKLDRPEVATIMIAATISSLLGHVFVGFISQYLGRRKTLTIFPAAAIILLFPAMFGLYNASSTSERILYIVPFVFVATTCFGAIPAFLSERFLTEVRNSAAGFVYNGGLIIGSWSPLIAINLLSNAGSLTPIVLSLNIMAGLIVALVGARLNPETRDTDLD
ncbi:MAG TPA: MFS transporter [Nitrososphaerales archaeon]|nr:MFS transporter [Nitrososphaerales archaeon]